MGWTVSGSGASLRSASRAGSSRRMRKSLNSGSARGERVSSPNTRRNIRRLAIQTGFLCDFFINIWTFKCSAYFFVFFVFKRDFIHVFSNCLLYHDGIKYIFYQISHFLCEICIDYKKQKTNNFLCKMISFIFLKYCLTIFSTALKHKNQHVGYMYTKTCWVISNFGSKMNPAIGL